MKPRPSARRRAASPPRRCTSHRGGELWPACLPAAVGKVHRAGATAERPLRLPPLVPAPALERDDLAPRVVVAGVLVQLFRDAEQTLTPTHFAPHVLGLHARGASQDDEVVQE